MARGPGEVLGKGTIALATLSFALTFINAENIVLVFKNAGLKK